MVPTTIHTAANTDCKQNETSLNSSKPIILNVEKFTLLIIH